MIGDVRMLLIGSAFALFFLAIGFAFGWRSRGKR